MFSSVLANLFQARNVNMLAGILCAVATALCSALICRRFFLVANCMTWRQLSAMHLLPPPKKDIAFSAMWFVFRHHSLGCLEKMFCVHRLVFGSHGVAADGLDVDWDPDAVLSNPRCCMRLHKSLLLNFSAKRPKRTRLRFSKRTSELNFLASCFMRSRCSRKLTILAT